MAFILSAATPLVGQTYRVTHTYTLGGEGRWDYVVPDPPHQRVFIARQDRVIVVGEDGKLLGEVTGINGAHGTAVVEDAGHGFATSGNDGMVVMFDLKTYKPLSRIPASEDADAIIFDPASFKVFTMNGDAHSSTVIDPRAGKVITNISLGGKPEYGAVTGGGKVYANLTDVSEVVEIDAALTPKVTRRWPTAPCKQPVSMAIDIVHHRIFSGCRSGVMAISDYDAGKVVATVPIGTGVDGAGYDPDTRNAFASNADGTFTVIHQDSPDQYHVVQTLETPQGSRNMGFDPKSHKIFVVSGKFGPAPTTSKGRPPVLPGSFSLMVIEH
jgi:DNA-binding beta-propeller fold protein YncE